MRVLTYIGVVAALTAGGVMLYAVGRLMGIPYVAYVLLVLVFFFPGGLYIRLHPDWKSKVPNAHDVALATAGSVLLGMLLAGAAIWMTPLAEWLQMPPVLLRQQLVMAALALLAPLSAYHMASNNCRRRRETAERARAG